MPDKSSCPTERDFSFSLKMTSPLPLETLAFHLATENKFQESQLVITETMEKAQIFMENYSFWTDKKAHLLPFYNPSVFSGVQISHRQIQDRLSWLFRAFNENNQIFVSPIIGMIQKTLKPECFMDHILEYSKGDHLPGDFFQKLHQLGYLSSPMVEDPGSFSNRGNLVDLFPPQMEFPIRMELFGDEIESLRTFDPFTQRTISEIKHFLIIPAREVLLNPENTSQVSQKFLKLNSPELQTITHSLRYNRYCENLEYYLPLFYEKTVTAFQYFQKPVCVWMLEEENIKVVYEKEIDLLKSLFNKNIHPLPPSEIFASLTEVNKLFSKKINLEKPEIIDIPVSDKTSFEKTKPFISKQGVSSICSDQSLSLPSCESIRSPLNKKFNEQMISLSQKLKQIPQEFFKVFSVRGKSQFNRMNLFLENQGYKCFYHETSNFQQEKLLKNFPSNSIHFFPGKLKKSFLLNSKYLAVFSLEHFFGKFFQKSKRNHPNEKGKHLSFGELKENDYIIHGIHGVCQFKGLRRMFVAGVESEFLQLEFKDKDKLFLPIYRIHQISKYSSEKTNPSLDKLGGSRFSNIKTKTKKRLREIAHDLIKIYANRSRINRPVYSLDEKNIIDFFNAFPYQETEDQIKAIEDVVTDLTVNKKPMDRLICGDVGFGKTEVAMRASFIVATDEKQVAILVPTTILTMQHYETFKKRFRDWPVNIQVVNRLQSARKIKKTLDDISKGKVDILIGTHRLLSQDVEFKELGLLVIDEEQKFGVKDKERIRKMKTSLDTLTLSATPIPRTFNMSLLKMRDLSLINTAPLDRLEVRTFICHFNKYLIKRAIETEIRRGGQVFFIHNRVQTIEEIAKKLRQWIPGVCFAVAHGQMKKKDLESVMISFFKNEIQVLIASTIIESGIDRPNANTIFINQADCFGLSQLYQLRGRVGRSTQRAYCYLITEQQKKLTDLAKERLKVIQENSSLGSGIQIAQYDLELRGAGTLLGEEQSGLIDSMGYEFYMQLLEEAIKEAHGEKQEDIIEPEINLKIKAFIPDSYIANIRLRLSYYRTLTQIKSPSDIDDLEEELKDRFGNPPEEVINLLGIMLIRHQCLQLRIQDISNTKDSLILKFMENTPLSTDHVVDLTNRPNKKYSITPNNRFKIKVREITWPRVQEEINHLLKLCH